MIGRSQPATYQQPVYRELLELARDHFEYHWHDLAVLPRTAALIVGASGSGKSFLCKRLAVELNAPLLDLQYSNWVVTGASSRGAVRTLSLLYRFVQDNDKGVILLDEIDKLDDQTGSDWTRAVHIELFSVLDRRILDGIFEATAQDPDQPSFILTRKEMSKKFMRGFFLVGAGAWQDLWRAPMPAGFSGTAMTRPHPTYKQLASTLRPEILNRFRTETLVIPPLTREDYQALVAETVDRLPGEFRALVRQLAVDSIDQAVEAQKGFRFVEELVAGAIRSLRHSQTQKRNQNRECYGPW
jgi:SpoVK/Ycf46/Vps4 family AAA+-type ATPase